MEIGDLPKKEFRVMKVKMIQDLIKRSRRCKKCLTRNLEKQKNKKR